MKTLKYSVQWITENGLKGGELMRAVDPTIEGVIVDDPDMFEIKYKEGVDLKKKDIECKKNIRDAIESVGGMVSFIKKIS